MSERGSISMNSEGNVRVSYIIVTKNRATYLERALTNVREFIEPADELIIIDGKSTDATGEVVARNQDIVTLFVSEPDEGEAHAFNKALFRTKGRYIKVITDDDYFYPDAMRRLVAEMEAHPDVDAIMAGGERWDRRGSGETFMGYFALDKSMPATARQIFDLVRCGLGLIVRREVFELTGGVSNMYKQADGDILCRFIECNCKLRYLDIMLYKWHIHPHSGFANLDNMYRDSLIFLLRMGRWEEFLSQDPEKVWLLLSPGSSKRHALFCGLWMAGRLNRTPLWWTPLVLRKAYRSLAKVVRGANRAIRQRTPKLIRLHIRGMRPGSRSGGVSSHAWSGELR
jgi:glycosyltransferase involved in cell wall biosynthesis